MQPNERLKAWIAGAEITQAEAARRLDGYDPGNLNKLLKGELKPTLELAAKIDDMTGGTIPITAWVGFEPSRRQAA